MATSSRRQRYRDDTIAEIRSHARAQLAEGGHPAVSLNAIAKLMGMTGPALYRYVNSRDQLLADLVTEAYDDLADQCDQAAAEAPADPPVARLLAVGHAFRDWARGHPEQYLLTFGATTGSGALSPEQTIPAAQRVMRTILDTLHHLDDANGFDHPTEPPTELADSISDWAQRRGEDHLDPAIGRLGLVTWTRLHGLISLELLGHLGQAGIDVDLLYESELDILTAEARNR